MRHSKSELAFLYSIRKCRTYGFYDLVRWNYADASGKKEINNSVKASFSRTKSILQEKGLIEVASISPIELSDDDFLDYAIHDTGSASARSSRRHFLPLIVSRSAESRAADDLTMLALGEDQIFGYRWGRLTVETEKLRDIRTELQVPLEKMYIELAKIFSRVYLENPYESKELERLLGCLISLLKMNDYRIYRRDEKNSFIELIHLLGGRYLNLLPDVFYRAANEYEALLRPQAQMFARHHRRIFFQSNLRETRMMAYVDRKYSQSRYPAFSGKIEYEVRVKIGILEDYFLKPEDFKFMKADYDQWSSGELVEFLKSTLAVSEVPITVISEIGGHNRDVLELIFWKRIVMR